MHSLVFIIHQKLNKTLYGANISKQITCLLLETHLQSTSGQTSIQVSPKGWNHVMVHRKYQNITCLVQGLVQHHALVLAYSITIHLLK